MLIDGISLTDTSDISNLIIDSGTSFPAGSAGEIFYRTDLSAVFFYSGTGWVPVAANFAERYTEPQTSISSAASTSINAQVGNNFTLTMTTSITTLGFTNVPAAGRNYNLTLLITQAGAGSYTIAWPTAVKWPGGTAPTLTTAVGKSDVITLMTTTGGDTWYGFVAGQNF